MSPRGRPKVIADACAFPGCSNQPYSRFPKPTKKDPDPPTLCRSHYEKASKGETRECSWDGCRNLRQWNKKKQTGNGFCRRHERDYIWSNPAKLELRLKEAAGNIKPMRGCLEWQLTKEEQGKKDWRGKISYGYPWLPYRLTYVALVDMVDANLELDHLCGSKFCILPTHLEPISGAKNKARDKQRVLSELNDPKRALEERRQAIRENTERVWEKPDAAERLTWFAQMAYPGASVPDALKLLSPSSYTRPLPGYTIARYTRSFRRAPEGISPSVLEMFYHRPD